MAGVAAIVIGGLIVNAISNAFGFPLLIEEDLMFDKRDYKQYLENLNASDLAKVVNDFGPDSPTVTSIVDFINHHPEKEAMICYSIKRTLGVDILTREELRHRLNVAAADSADEAGKHAKESNGIAHEANEIAIKANDYADQANRIAVAADITARHARDISWWNTAGTILAAVIAIAALIVSLAK